MKLPKRNILLAVLLLLVFLLIFSFLSYQQQKIEQQQKKLPQITLVNSEGVQVKFSIEIANTESAREKGLSGRDSLPEGAGMFFVFDSEQPLGFWMPDMKFPIDMIFLDSAYKIVDINENAQPCETREQCPTFVSKKPAKYVLEVNAGLVRKNNIKVGDRAIL